MLVCCPQCKAEFRMVDFEADARVVKYLCPSCEQIVPIDLEMDEVKSSSSSSHFSALERPKTILVADDSPEMQETAAELLTEAGYDVVTVGDGADALTQIRDRHPDLVVLDLLMPGVTGFDVLRELKADERIAHIPVLAMSGVYRENVLEFVHGLGAVGFMDKRQISESLSFRVGQILSPDADS